MHLHYVGDTIIMPDQAGQGHPVYTTRTGRRYYARVGGCWYYATPVPPTGFALGPLVPRSLASRLWAARYASTEANNA